MKKNGVIFGEVLISQQQFLKKIHIRVFPFVSKPFVW